MVKERVKNRDRLNAALAATCGDLADLKRQVLGHHVMIAIRNFQIGQIASSFIKVWEPSQWRGERIMYRLATGSGFSIGHLRLLISVADWVEDHGFKNMRDFMNECDLDTWQQVVDKWEGKLHGLKLFRRSLSTAKSALRTAAGVAPKAAKRDIMSMLKTLQRRQELVASR